MTPEALIKHLNLKPLPLEGGFFAETCRSEEWLSADQLPSRYSGKKPYYTAIYYLLTPETFSALHRLPTDEVFHFYLGDPVQMLNLFEDGTSAVITLGQDLFHGQTLQYRVPKNTWQGSRLMSGGRFALLGTTMAPGFDFDDFTPADRDALSASYPQRCEMIRELTVS
ncbi:MAG: cupin domain-containing protein [Sinomicrobium sp.]|nr:cupin domain-containing protein [Sinomicrobium sp.]